MNQIDELLDVLVMRYDADESKLMPIDVCVDPDTMLASIGGVDLSLLFARVAELERFRRDIKTHLWGLDRADPSDEGFILSIGIICDKWEADHE